MIHIADIGMNHETAPVELRECIAREPEHVSLALTSMRELPYIREGLFLSTCNRVEALYATEDPDAARKWVVTILSRIGGLPEEHFSRNLYAFEDMAAVRHIFRVASSLDSMIVGEPQILGQIKDAYFQATREKTSGVILNRLMHRAFHVAKRVRTETGVSDAAVSVSFAAVELAKKIFRDLSGKAVLLIGAGEMAELAARHLITQGVETVRVANRTFRRAVEVAEAFQGSPVSYDEIEQQLLEVDIVICSTAAREYVMGFDQVKGALRKRRNRPLFLIDIAVPRDVEPEVNELDNVYLYDIDDLKGIIDINKAKRRQEAVKAERIVEEEVLKFEKWMQTLDVVPTIISLKDKAEGIRRAELKRSLSGLGPLTAAQRKGIENLTASIAEKLINDPILVLKRKADRNTRDIYLDIARKLFNLDPDDGE
jgi:glutamyl-tRNA reductase